MKKLSQEDDLTLLNQLSVNNLGIPSFREMAYFVFMIVLYYSGLARWLFWTLFIVLIILFIQYAIEYSNHKTKDRLIEDELKRRNLR